MAITARGLVAQRDRFRLCVDAFDADASGTALLGRNGAGKSTLLLALQGLLRHNGLVERSGRCAGVFAQPAVLRGSVVWNVAAVVRAATRIDQPTAQERATRMLSSVDLSNVMSLDARRLSSGQRQRLALARALALEPRTLFLDEPFANVDADGRPGLRELVREYIARSDCALVLATQNLADVTTLCKKAMVLEDGVPIEMLDVSAIETSRNPYLQAIVCESRLLP
jgi:ABC-type sulfate/molybdate transport systems ATPase subunit